MACSPSHHCRMRAGRLALVLSAAVLHVACVRARVQARGRFSFIQVRSFLHAMTERRPLGPHKRLPRRLLKSTNPRVLSCVYQCCATPGVETRK